MPDNETRPALHCYLSKEAHAAYHDFAAEHGISVSGLLEAIAAQLCDLPGSGNVVIFPGQIDVVKHARRIDAQRRRRGGRSLQINADPEVDEADVYEAGRRAAAAVTDEIGRSA